METVSLQNHSQEEQSMWLGGELWEVWIDIAVRVTLQNSGLSNNRWSISKLPFRKAG